MSKFVFKGIPSFSWRVCLASLEEKFVGHMEGRSRFAWRVIPPFPLGLGLDVSAVRIVISRVRTVILRRGSIPSAPPTSATMVTWTALWWDAKMVANCFPSQKVFQISGYVPYPRKSSIKRGIFGYIMKTAMYILSNFCHTFYDRNSTVCASEFTL